MKNPARASALSLLLLVTASVVLAQPSGQPRPPAGPAPVNAEGRVLLQGATPAQKGVWTPVFGILDPVAPYETVPFQPWSKALYDARQIHELEPHARCRASGSARQFMTPYGVEFVEFPELEE